MSTNLVVAYEDLHFFVDVEVALLDIAEAAIRADSQPNEADVELEGRWRDWPLTAHQLQGETRQNLEWIED